MDEGTVFVEELSQRLRPLNDLVEELQAIGLDFYIKLPSIAVVGEQSTGKSSVLESIVGEDFLPKSDELATRLPIRLHLVREKYAPDDFDTYAIIKGSPEYDDVKCSMAELAQRIKERTSLIAGDNYNIINHPIVIDIHSKECPELTLVDLPGIARIPRPDSDQPEDIEGVTKGLINEYIQKPETIILSVIPANTDPAGSDALKMSKLADKEGDRTIGVFTKIDIMDQGTNAKKMLNGDFHRLKLGYVGVKNRSKREVDEGVTVKAALENERKFFATHPIYKEMDSRFFGAKNLSLKLMRVLEGQIETSLPDITDKVAARKIEVAKKLDSLGEPVPDKVHEQQKLIFNLIKRYTTGIGGVIEGNYDSLPEFMQNKITSNATFGAAEIRKIFDVNFAAEVQSIDIDELTDDQLLKTMLNTMGASLPDFLPFSAFKNLIVPYVKKVHPVAKNCLECVYQYIQSIAKELCKHIFSHFPIFQTEISKITAEVLLRSKEFTNEKLSDLLKSKCYIYTVHKEYTNNASPKNELAQPLSPLSLPQTVYSSSSASSSSSSKPLVDVPLMRTKLTVYFDRVFKPDIIDSVPQTIGTFLLGEIEEQLDMAFLGITSNVQKFGELLEEPMDRKAEREKLVKEQEILLKAHVKLSEFSWR